MRKKQGAGATSISFCDASSVSVKCRMSKISWVSKRNSTVDRKQQGERGVAVGWCSAFLQGNPHEHGAWQMETVGMTGKVQRYLDVSSAGNNYFPKSYYNTRETKPALLLCLFSSLCLMCMFPTNEINLKMRQAISFTDDMESHPDLRPAFALRYVCLPKFSSSRKLVK